MPRMMTRDQAQLPVLSIQAFNHFFDAAPKRCERGQTSYNGECLRCHAAKGERCPLKKAKR